MNSDDPAAEQSDRLAPRPLYRPETSDAERAVFGRPDGVTGSFDPGQQAEAISGSQQHGGISVAPPPAPLAEAFDRPPEQSHGGLQRPPEQARPAPEGHAPSLDDALWGEGAADDPWRNPLSAAALGRPAVAEEATTSANGPRLAARLGIGQAIFGRPVATRTVVLLTVAALLIAVIGGLVARWGADTNPLTGPEVTLAQVEPEQDGQQNSVARLAEEVLPAVVSIDVSIGNQRGSGSGVVIDGNGYVLTNNHVVSPVATAGEDADSALQVVFSDGSRTDAKVVGRDPKTDLAVIKVKVSNPTVAQLGRSSDLRVGDQVIAVGSPLGLESTVTAGIVSALHRPVRLEGEATDTNAVIDAIQSDAAINPGNSGGALVNAQGAVVGINSAIRTLGSSEQAGSIGLGFAIPIDFARQIAQELIRTGSVDHTELGVNARSVSDGDVDGAQVQNVTADGAADKAGVREGDVITSIDGREIDSSDELLAVVQTMDIGATVTMTVVRDGREIGLQVTLQSD